MTLPQLCGSSAPHETKLIEIDIKSGLQMNIGTAVFLPAILVSLVLLYGFTRNQWRWRRIFGFTALGIAGVVLMLSVLISGDA